MYVTKLFALATLLLAFSGCTYQNSKIDKQSDLNVRQITLENNTPTVDLASYTLIASSASDRQNDAAEILQLKRKWPLAMQSLDPLAFDSILSNDFTFKGERFFNRADYIKNRTTPDDWKITFVRYSNVTLQFFGDRAVLSYVNQITNRNSKTDAIEYEHISWVDIYKKENDQWKLEAAHAIDYRLEVPEELEKTVQQ